MEYISETAQLLLGTDSEFGGILTHQITDYINFFDNDLPRIANMEHYDDYEDDNNQKRDAYGDDYDVLEGKDVNQELERLIKQNQVIMKKDKAGTNF